MLTFLALTISLPPVLNAAGTSGPTVAESTLVFENHGVVLKPRGLIAMNSTEQHISIFQKLKLPQITKIPTCQLPVTSDWITQANYQIKQNTCEFLNMYQNIANPNSTPNRGKRSIIAGIGVSLGLGIVDLLLTGISYKSLKSHIAHVQQNLDKFVSSQHHFNEKILPIDENIIHIIDSLKSDINSQFRRNDCKIAIETGRLFANQLIFQWDHKLNSLFKSAITGQITTPLTPDILSPKDLMAIIADHSILKFTYFSKNAYNLYRDRVLTIGTVRT